MRGSKPQNSSFNSQNSGSRSNFSRDSRSNNGGGKSGSYRGGGNSNQNSGYNQNRSFSGRGGNRFNAPRRKQPIFDPTNYILQTQITNSQIQIEEEVVPVANQFSDFEISDQLKQNIERKGYTTPTPIQDQAIPHILNGRDVVGIANTGTGKTGAFLIPLIEKVSNNYQEKVLIIVPTRELALQVREELLSLSGNMRIFSTLCIGGSSIMRQIDSLRRGQHFVIGTPGRIKDLNLRKKIKFEQFSNIILDEVDRMLDMGFVNEIKEIIQVLPQNRQSLFFSATMNDKVKEIMKSFLTNPEYITVKKQDSIVNVVQEIVKIKGRFKIDVLHDLLITEGFEKVLVFGRTKHGTEKISQELQSRGFKVDSIHGNKSQGQRQRALKSFKNNHIQALIATDVIARGLDIDNVSHVINFDLPESYDDYIHRIGRTGRAEKTGVALTFVER